MTQRDLIRSVLVLGMAGPVLAGWAGIDAAREPDQVVQGAPAAEPASLSPRAVADYEALLAVSRSKIRTGAVLYPAAVSRDDLRAVAIDRLGRGEGDVKSLFFAVNVIWERWDDAAALALDRAMADASLSRVVRGNAEWRLHSMTGDYLLRAEPFVDDRRPFDERVASLRERMKTKPPLTDGRHLPLLDKLFRECEKILAECAEPDAARENLQVIEPMSVPQQWLEWGGEEGVRAAFLADYLKRLRAMPRGVNDEEYDQIVGSLQVYTLYNFQNYLGPLDGAEIEHESRDAIDQVIDDALRWWEEAKDRDIIERRMERLAARGYRVGKKDDRKIVSAELLRAVRAGDAGEARAAADVLRGLGLDCGTVPLGRIASWDRAEADVVLALIRGQVSGRAAELMMEKGWVGWSAERERWELVPTS